MRLLRRYGPPAAALLAAAGTLAPARHARADDFGHRLAAHVELGAGTMIPDYQRASLQYGLALQGNLHLAVTVLDPVALQLSVGQNYFPSDAGAGGAVPITLGARLEPRISDLGRLFLDLNGGVVLTGNQTRFGLDAGLGFEFAATRYLHAGPYVRYTNVFATDQDAPSNAGWVTVGLSLAARLPPEEHHVEPPPEEHHEPRPVPNDADRDGITDADDRCPREPAGEHPDPTPDRHGCPEPDTDNDGLVDSEDRCVGLPAGDHPDPDYPGCPDHDDDGDGLVNHQDACPTEPPGLHPDPDRAGCPRADRDRDTVPDVFDHCPDQPGAPSADPARNGCPGLVRVQNNQIVILQQVFFASNRATILRRSFPVLQAVADALRASPEIHRVSVDGHTDDAGPDERNMTLSQRRADSVLRYLIDVAHIDANRLEAHGFGETRPTTPTEGLRGRALRDARAQNRRVEFNILDPAPARAAGSTAPQPP